MGEQLKTGKNILVLQNTNRTQDSVTTSHHKKMKNLKRNIGLAKKNERKENSIIHCSVIKGRKHHTHKKKV